MDLMLRVSTVCKEYPPSCTVPVSLWLDARVHVRKLSKEPWKASPAVEKAG